MSQNIWKLQGYLLNRQVRRAQFVKSLLKHSKAKLILDIGCGEGFLTSYFSQLRRQVIGVDIDIESIKIAKNRVKNVSFICASITAIPFRDGTFEAVTVLEILEHLPNATISEGIAEVDRILKPNGTLIVSVPYNEEITYTRCIHCRELTPLWGHLQSFDENKLSSILPENYKLVKEKHLPNLGLISCSKLLSWLPLRIWLLINDLLGIIKKGYWIVIRYVKSLEV